MTLPPRDAAPLRLPSLDGLRALEAAARLGSFERAADELAITASAISKRVATVEELLGSALFVRSGKSLSLTPSGRDYLQQVSPALALLAAVPQHRREQQRLRKLRVTTPPTFARQILVPALESFTSAHPDIELELVLSIPFMHISSGDSDIEVLNGDAQALGGQLLMHDRVLPMAAPSWLARQPPLRQPADLARLPLLRTPLEPWAPWFRAAGLHWAEPAAGPKLVDLGLALEAAVSGQGVVLGRPTLAKRWLDSAALVAPFAISARPGHQYLLLPHADTGAVGLFARWLTAHCAQWERAAHAGVAVPEPLGPPSAA